MKRDGDITSRWYGKKTYVLHVVMQLACREVAYKAFLYQLLAMAMLHVLSLFATLPKSKLEPENHCFEKGNSPSTPGFCGSMLVFVFFVTFLRMSQRFLTTDDLAFIRINHKSWEKKI